MRLLIGSGVAGVSSRFPGLRPSRKGTVGVEQVPGIRKQLHPLVLDPAEDCPEGGEQPAPGIVPPLQDLLALLVGRLLELGHKGRDGVCSS